MGARGWLFGVVALALAFTPLTDAGAQTVLRRGNAVEPETLDPHKATGTPEAVILNDLFEGLMVPAADGTAIPGAAQSMDISPDGKTYRFTLRTDGRWSNGDPVTAEDFVYSFRRALAPETAADFAPVFRVIKGASAYQTGKDRDPNHLAVTAKGPLALEIQLENPTPHFPAMLVLVIAKPVHRKTVEAFGDQWPRPGNMVSNGPYVLTGWKPQAQVVLEKSPTFHAAREIAIGKVIYLPTEDEQEEFKRFRAGELDLTWSVPADQLAVARTTYPAALRESAFLGSYYLIVNLTRPPLGQMPEVRRALSLAIDRAAPTQMVLRGAHLPAASYVPQGMPGYSPAPLEGAGQTQAQRLEAAKALMAKAGYGPEKPLEIEYLYNTSEQHKRIAVALAAMWKPLGVKTTLVNQEWKVYLETRDQKNFQIARAGWIASYADPSPFLDLLLSDAGERNDAGYNNPAFDRLFAEAESQADGAKRLTLLSQAEALVLKDLPVIPVYQYRSWAMVDPRVKGYIDNPLNFHLTRWMSLTP